MAKKKNKAVCSLTDDDRKRLELDRQSYDKLGAEQCLALDKSIIGIAGASFSIAIAFIDKIIHFDKAFWLWSFWLAMLLLVISIIVTTISFWCSENAISYARKCVDDCERTEDINELYKPNFWVKALRAVNNIRLGAFILGMFFLGFFIFSNGIAQSYGKDQQEGAVSDKNTKQTINNPGKDSGRFGFEPPQPRPQSSQQQPQQQPQQPAPSSTEKK